MTPSRRSRQPDRLGPARLDRSQQVADHGPGEGLIANRDRTHPAGLPGVAVAQRGPDRVAVQEAVPALEAQEAMVLGVGDTQQLLVQRIHHARQLGMARTAGWSGSKRLEGHGDHAQGQVGQDLRHGQVAADRQERQAGDDPVAAVQGVRDRLGAVGGGGQECSVLGRRQDRLEHPPSETEPLLRGADEAHRQVPQPLAPDCRGEADDPARPLGDDEESGIGGEQVPMEPDDPAQVVRDRMLVEPAGVVVNALAPDLGAGLDIVRSGGPDRYLDHEVGSDAASGVPPVARRSSSACMNVSRSPSRTAPVLLVSTSVRRSLTIW